MPAIDLDPIIDTLRRLNAGLVALAKLTPTAIDDQICAGIQAVLDSAPLIAFIKQLVGDTDTPALLAAGNHAALAAHIEAKASPDIREAVAAAGFDWQKWITIAVQILQLIQPFLHK